MVTHADHKREAYSLWPLCCVLVASLEHWRHKVHLLPHIVTTFVLVHAERIKACKGLVCSMWEHWLCLLHATPKCVVI